MRQAKSRARAFDHEHYSEAMHLEDQRYMRKWRTICFEANQSCEQPEADWFCGFLIEQRARHGAGYTRRYARSLGHHFRCCGAPNLTLEPAVRAILYAPDETDPLSCDDVHLGRAQPYADNSYCPTTYRDYAERTKKWRKLCASEGIDPLAPPPGRLLRWLQDLGITYASNSVRNYRSAVSSYLRKNGVEDVANTAEIDAFLRALEVAKPKRCFAPVTAAQRRAMIESFTMQGADLRNRTATLLIAFTRFGADNLVLLDVEHLTFRDNGVEIRSHAGGEPVFLGRHPDAVLDPIPLLEKLIAAVGSTGPLFRPVNRKRMCFDDYRMASLQLHTVIREAAVKAGIVGGDISPRLKLLFEIEVTHGHSEVAYAHHQDWRKLRHRVSESHAAARIGLASGRRRYAGRASW